MQGILFKPDMIQAIVDLRKTVTRRAINPQPTPQCQYGEHIWEGKIIDWIGYKHEGKTAFYCRKCGEGLKLIDEWSGHGRLPRYQVGETVYIKEAHKFTSFGFAITARVVYKDGESKDVSNAITDGTTVYNEEHPEIHKWHSPLFMPAWAARTFLKITDVSAGRVQEITEEDAIAEGITIMQGSHQAIEQNPITGELKLIGKPEPFTARYHYSALWDSINGDGDFALNKWVWRYAFEVVK